MAKVDFNEVARAIGPECTREKAQRCWEIWQEAKFFNYPATITDPYGKVRTLTAEENVRNTFQFFSSLPDRAVLSITTALKKFEADRKPAEK